MHPGQKQPAREHPAWTRTVEADTARRFAASAALGRGDRAARDEFDAWFAGRAEAHHYQVTRVPLSRLGGWSFEPLGGNLVHDSGKFFSVQGLRVHCAARSLADWTQPIIVQPEIGLLGVLVKEFDGVLHCLMQAKMEPGNLNGVQLSPTVQATRSNYTGVHGGRSTRYLEYFRRSGERRVLADSLQSEQGSWFLHKRNRNMIVETREDVPLHEDFRWLPLGQLYDLLATPHLVNMDTRTVLSTIPGPAAGEPAHTLDEVLSWLTEVRSTCPVTQQRLPLNQAAEGGWRRTPDEIAHSDGLYFRMIGVDVRAPSREVGAWSQPLLAPTEPGVVAWLVKRIGGTPHLLTQARCEAGSLTGAELAPTVQCQPGSYRAVPEDRRPRFLDEVLSAQPSRVRYDVWQSEEGGRFYHARNRYMIVEAGDGAPAEAPDGFCWLTPGQLSELVRHSNYLNVEARSLFACWRSAARGP